MLKTLTRRLWAHRYLTSLVLILALALRSVAGVPDPISDPEGFICYVATAIFFGDCEALDNALFLVLGAQQGDAAAVFEPNLGQAERGYDFVVSGGAADFLLTSRGPTVRSRRGEIRANYSGAATASPEPLDPLPGRIHYLIGNRPDRWITDVPSYGRVRYRNIYPGIDIIYYSKRMQLEHDFVVAPGADPTRIRVQFSGVDHMEVDAQGTLQLHGPGATLSWRKPEIYQEAVEGVRRAIPGRYRIDSSNSIGFEVGVFDPKKPLVIDPVLAFSTYYGRGNGETAFRAAVDPNGNVYYTGVSGDPAYPQTGGALSGGPFVDLSM